MGCWRMFVLHLVVFLLAGGVDVSHACIQGCTCDLWFGLKRLSCPRSDLERFPVGIDRGTQFLRLEGNRIRDIPGNLSLLLPDLQMIDMAGNKVKRLRSKIFAGLKNLRDVNLLNNEIEAIEDRIFEGSETDRMNLKLRGNKLHEINRDAFRGLLADSKIDLSGNSIRRMYPETLRGVRVMKLDLSYNQLEQLPNAVFQNQNQLYFLELRDNNISSLRDDVFTGLSSLETLDLSSNNLKDLPVDIFKHNVVLKELNLDSNKFAFPPLLNLPAQKIDLTMRNNPVVCDCELKRLLSNSSYKVVVTDFNKATCRNDSRSVSEVLEQTDCRTTTPPPPTTTSQPTTVLINTTSITTNKTINHNSTHVNTTQNSLNVTVESLNSSHQPTLFLRNTTSTIATTVASKTNRKTTKTNTPTTVSPESHESKISRLTALILSMVAIVFIVAIGTLCWYLGRRKIKDAFELGRERVNRMLNTKSKTYLVNDVDNWEYKSGPEESKLAYDSV